MKRSRSSELTRFSSGVPDWAFPHVDAETYLDDVIKHTAAELQMNNEQSFDAPVEDYVPKGEEEKSRARIVPMNEEHFEELVGNYISDEDDEPHSRIAQMDERLQERHEAQEYDLYEGILRENYDAPEDIRETASDIRDRLTSARHALARGDAEALIEALGPLLELTREDIDEDTVFNWSGLLADTRIEPLRQSQCQESSAQVAVAVDDLCHRLCHLIARDKTSLRFIEWRRLEEIIAHILSRLGFEVILTQPSKDGGKDVVAKCQLKGRTLRYFIEIKHWRSGKRVSEDCVYDFLEINTTEQTEGGLFVSTSGFTPTVFSRLAELGREHIRLGAESKVVTLCQHFARRDQGLWTPSQTLPELLFEETYE